MPLVIVEEPVVVEPGTTAATVGSQRVQVSVPHFNVPLRYVNGAPTVNEQDSPADIAACVYAVVATEQGSRDEMPDFGLADPTLTQEPIPAAILLAQISQQEPRAPLLVDAVPDAYDAAVVNVNIEVE